MFLSDIALFSTIRINSANVLRNGKIFFRTAHRRKFEKGLKKISSNIDEDMLEKLMRFQEQGLSKFEGLSIIKYARKEYRRINDFPKNVKIKQIPEDVYTLRPLIDRGLRKLPPLKLNKPLLRYIKIDNDNVQSFLNLHTSPNLHNIGRVTFDKGIMQTNTPYSTGRYTDKLTFFKIKYPDKTLVEYSITPTTKSRGKYLEPFLENGEHEVLFPSKTRFKIKKIDDSRLNTDKIIHIDLEEL